MIALGLYVLTIFAANWALTTFGLVPVWPGLLAPAGVLFAGLSFTLRDLVQDRLGRGWTIVAILCGAALSAFLSPSLALASGLAFLVSEAADMAIYCPLRDRGKWLTAVFASNVIGSVADSIIFLGLAFGSLDFLAGQLIGKWEMTIAAVVVMAAARWYRQQIDMGRQYV